MRTVHHRPFSLGRDMETILNGLFDTGASDSAWLPRINVAELEDTLTVSVAVPGYSADALDITIEDGVLKISGAAAAGEVEGMTYHRHEIADGPFTRSVRIPKAYSTEEVRASYQDGILEIALTKRPEVAPRTIEITTTA